MMKMNARRRFTIKLRLLLAMAAVAALTAGCAAPKQHRKTLVTVAVANDQRVRFSGKGAGAGIALSSSMGPAGIAIGVAIDEGIAKDIGRALQIEDFDIATAVTTAFTAPPSQFDRVNIRVVRYGFMIRPSDTNLVDAVAPQLHLEIAADGQALTVRIPEDANAGQSCSLTQYELAAIRADGQLAVQSLNEAAHCAINIVRGEH